MEYVNPLPVFITDPYVFRDGNNYYVYGTASSAISVYSSLDLVNWRMASSCYQRTSNSWGQIFWFPCVVKSGQDYLLYYTSMGKSGGRGICVAKSSSPLGPFADIKTPLFQADTAYTSCHVFQDPQTGRTYIYLAEDRTNSRRMVVARLDASMLDIETDPAECFVADQQWENGSVEAPHVLLHNSTYYMLYTGRRSSDLSWGVGYATAISPLGPWTKYPKSPVLAKTPAVCSPGGRISVTTSVDQRELFALYQRLSTCSSKLRVPAIDRIRFEHSDSGADVLSFPDGPSDKPQPIPSGSPPHARAVSDDFTMASLDPNRWMIFNEDSAKYRVADGALIAMAEAGDIHRARADVKNIFLQYAPAGDFCVSTRVTIDAKTNYEQAGLIIWQDPDNYLRFSSLYADGKGIELGKEVNQLFTSILAPNKIGSTVLLGIEKKGITYISYMSPDGEKWTETARYEFDNLKNLKVGLVAYTASSVQKREARFDYFHVDQPGFFQRKIEADTGE